MEINSSLKVVVLPSFYPMSYHYTRGGFFEEQTRLIKNNGVDISVVFNEDRSISSFKLSKLRHVHFQKQFNIEHGLPVFRRMNWNVIPTKFELGRKIWIRQSIKLVEAYMNKYGKPDLFHVHCAFNAGSVAKYLNHKYKIPYIITEHSTFFALSDVTNEQKVEVCSIYNLAERVFVVSSPFKKLLSEKTGFDFNKIDVIPNFIDTDYFNPSFAGKPKKANNFKTIFTVCHHGYKKRLDRLIASFKMISLDYPDWKLVIGGIGNETANLKKQVKELDLENRIVFTGFLSKEQVRDNMKISSVFVLPSDVETFGVVIIEAMAMGLPVVATESGGPEDIITSDTGLLVKKEIESLSNGIIQVISNFELYNKDVIRAYVLNNYSGHTVANKYVKIYKEIINS